MSDRYWEEAVECALSDEGIAATKEQIANIAGSIQVCHENFGMAHGYDCIPNPVVQENERLQRELSKERSKRVCEECSGRGRIVTNGPYHSSDSECHKCRGEGKL